MHHNVFGGLSPPEPNWNSERSPDLNLKSGAPVEGREWRNERREGILTFSKQITATSHGSVAKDGVKNSVHCFESITHPLSKFPGYATAERISL